MGIRPGELHETDTALREEMFKYYYTMMLIRRQERVLHESI